MATINGKTVNGLFEAGIMEVTSVTESQLTFACADAKDPVFFVADLTSADADITLAVCDTQGKEIKSVPLVKGEMNIVPMTTYGIKNSEGFMTLELISESDISAQGVKAGIILYTPVINR